MFDERYESPSLTRRRVLAGLSTAGAVSLAGCSSPLFDDTDADTTSTIEGVKLAELPEGQTDNPRIAVPSEDLIEEVNFRNQQQIRVDRPGVSFEGDFTDAIYTTKQNVDFNNNQENTIWMSSSGLNRINASEGWQVSITSTAPHEEFDTGGDAEENNEYVEQVIDASGSNLITVAPYGGDIYPFTDAQAIRIASELSESAWVCHGYNEGGGAYDRWFVPQTLLHPRSFPKLSELISYDGDEDEDVRHKYDSTYDHAILFTATDKRGVYVGGLIPDKIKTQLHDEIKRELETVGASDVPVFVERTGDIGGTDTMNIANRLSDDGHNGVQISQGENVRENYWKVVSDGVISVFEDM